MAADAAVDPAEVQQLEQAYERCESARDDRVSLDDVKHILTGSADDNTGRRVRIRLQPCTALMQPCTCIDVVP